jgi:hypothetical protein
LTGALAGRTVPAGYAKYSVTPRSTGGEKHSALVPLSDASTVRQLLTTVFNLNPGTDIPELPPNTGNMFFEVDDALMQA